MEQDVQFCTSADGVSIAYATMGTGFPIVKAANWMNHIELDRSSPVWSHVFEEFARDRCVIRYDERGTGLSDRHVEDLSFEAFVNDLEAVIEAAGVDRFALLGISQGGPVAIEYATRHPDRVSHLILQGTFATGWRRIPNLPREIVEKTEAQVTMIRHTWGAENPATRQFWTTLCIPNATPEEADSFNEIQRTSVTPETAARIFEAIGEFDVAHRLAKLDLPVLVLHSRNEATVGFEEGRRLASQVKGARLVALDSANHLLMRHEPAWARYVAEVRAFLGESEPAVAVADPSLRMKLCPKCGKLFGNEMIFCLDDGERLSEPARSDGRSDDATETQLLGI